ncbi:5'-nucleotidase [Ottowia sp. SB7-C50]|uniref:5'-nucleotidase n=1 Tax=Ottowia sp. SB7-C50 TaxID=3081231 RepID=UPI002953E4FC|nr:5'-nucleotidase [Ottowia sp. SB7-C50]WOP14999.1 5'-nucleotidase [Ottowia sp. SB7-C50]
MAATLQDQLVVAISSRALFDFEEENRLFDAGNAQAYMRLQFERLDTPAPPGVAFSLVKKLLAFNAAGAKRVEVVILSRNDPASGLRVLRSAKAQGLHQIERGVFTQGRDPFHYLRPLGAHLFLSANGADVAQALALGYPAAQVATAAQRASDAHPHEVRIAFDGDAVLFSDEAERIYQSDGLHAFESHEIAKAAQPLDPGPFHPFLTALHRLQQSGDHAMRIRTALVTARGAATADRPIQTLRHWGISVDEAMFLGGLPKGEFLREFQPDFFFDDQTGHIESAAAHVPAGHVAAGVTHVTSGSASGRELGGASGA